MREITSVATGADRSPQSGSGREGFLASLKFLTWNKQFYDKKMNISPTLNCLNNMLGANTSNGYRQGC
jgi:hypothetical protein